MAIFTIDSYSESFVTNGQNLYSGGLVYFSQCFTCDINSILDSCKFYIKKTGTPTGYAYAEIYAMTGTYGTDAKPTGEALATSDAFDISTLTTSYQLIPFTFSGVNKITLLANKYCLVVSSNNGNSNNFINIGYDNTSATHDGNWARSTNGSFWITSTNDACFYVYGDELVFTAGLVFISHPKFRNLQTGRAANGKIWIRFAPGAKI